MQILDSDGNVIEEWKSTDEAHLIEAKLIAGMTYTLYEAASPNGYELAKDIQFTVSLDGSIDDVNMIDAKTPKPHTPQTGDGFNMLFSS